MDTVCLCQAGFNDPDQERSVLLQVGGYVPSVMSDVCGLVNNFEN